jgi:hypothetical protein
MADRLVEPAAGLGVLADGLLVFACLQVTSLLCFLHQESQVIDMLVEVAPPENQQGAHQVIQDALLVRIEFFRVDQQPVGQLHQRQGEPIEHVEKWFSVILFERFFDKVQEELVIGGLKIVEGEAA